METEKGKRGRGETGKEREEREKGRRGEGKGEEREEGGEGRGREMVDAELLTTLSTTEVPDSKKEITQFQTLTLT